MEDKILKALECRVLGKCSECPYESNEYCENDLMNDILDLITEQKQYISDLERDIRAFKSLGLTASAIKEILSENESLKKEINEAYESAKNDIIELIKRR